MSNTFDNIIFNIVGGAIVVLLDRVIIWACKKYTGYRFKRIFGNKVENYHIVYSELKYERKTPDDSIYIFSKEGVNEPFSSLYIIPSCESRAANYLNIVFYKSLAKNIELVPDTKVRYASKLSYCSIGGFNNYKSVDIIKSELNIFFNIERRTIISKLNPNDRYEFSESNNDLCAIIKIRDKEHTKICIAGLGEWGTSGGAWYLANKWKELKKIVNDSEFGAIVKVKHYSDDSAELVYVVYGYELKIYKCN